MRIQLESLEIPQVPYRHYIIYSILAFVLLFIPFGIQTTSIYRTQIDTAAIRQLFQQIHLDTDITIHLHVSDSIPFQNSTLNSVKNHLHETNERLRKTQASKAAFLNLHLIHDKFPADTLDIDSVDSNTYSDVFSYGIYVDCQNSKKQIIIGKYRSAFINLGEDCSSKSISTHVSQLISSLFHNEQARFANLENTIVFFFKT
jgi:hypothetical protein